MNRKEFARMVSETKGNSTSIRVRLLAHYRSPEGLREIAEAPPWHRHKTPEEIVELLVKEVHDYELDAARAQGGGKAGNPGTGARPGQLDQC